MRHTGTAALAALTTISLFFCGASSAAGAANPGGTLAPSAPLAGGSQYGVIAQNVTAPRPIVRELAVPGTATPGKPPRVTVRIDEAGVRTVQAQLAVFDLSTRRAVIVLSMGWIPTGRSLAVNWPRGAKLNAGSYHVGLSAHDHNGGALLRKAHSSGVATLLVAAPEPAPAAVRPSAPFEGEAGVPTPAQTAAAGAVFPVAAAHSLGDAGNRFGAPRGNGRTHQGQDVLAAEGSPDVFPLSGTVLAASYQAGGAGYYAVEHTTGGFDFFFAHCQAGSVAVRPGEAVAAGQKVCHVGQTGSATTPHLHFEIWVGGWWAAGGHPIDPLPYLQAWDHS